MLIPPMIGEEGFILLVKKARNQYLSEVVTQKKSYHRFAQDFINSNKFHDAPDAWSKNQHNYNYGRVCALLIEQQNLAESFFNQTSVTDADCKQLIVLFNHCSITPEKTTKRKSLTFDDKGSAAKNSSTSLKLAPLPDDIIDLIVLCANEVNLFYEPVTRELFEALYADRPFQRLTSVNNNLTVLFFDIFHEYGLISRKWQSIICKHNIIISSSGEQYLTESVLRNTLRRARNRYTDPDFAHFIDKVHRLIKENKRK